MAKAFVGSSPTLPFSRMTFVSGDSYRSGGKLHVTYQVATHLDSLVQPARTCSAHRDFGDIA